MTYPHRIVCLTEETTETLYLLGEGDRVVGVSGYTVRPPEARQKPKVSSFLHARFEKIEALEPDLVLAFSDLQADITTELVKRGHTVFTFNQRSVAEILQMIRVLAGIVGVAAKGEELATRARGRARHHQGGVSGLAAAAARLLRGVGRSADLGNPVGRRARRGRRGRAGFSRTAATPGSPRIESSPATR